MTNMSIPINKIYISGSLKNRGSIDEITEDVSFVELRSSIMETEGVIHPIVVIEDTEHGKWRILSGQRRFLATKSIYDTEKDERFKNIRATVVQSESIGEIGEYMLSRHENSFRSDISKNENAEFVLGAIPFYFKIGKKDEEVYNIGLGMSIAKLLKTATNKNSSSQAVFDTIKELEEVTKSSTPIEKLDAFFRKGSLNQAKFLRELKITEFTEEIRKLYQEGKVLYQAAARLEQTINIFELKSQTEKLVLEIGKGEMSRREAGKRAYKIRLSSKDDKKEKLSPEKLKMINKLSLGLNKDSKEKIEKLFWKIERIIKKEKEKS